jgi:hypothetical protein
VIHDEEAKIATEPGRYHCTVGLFKIHFTEPNPNHLKINNINYWPSSGKVFIDGANACLPDRGIHALEALLGQRGYRRSNPTTRTNTLQPPHSTTPSLSVELDQA